MMDNLQLDWFERSHLEQLLEIETEPIPTPAPIRKIYIDAKGIEWEYPTYAPIHPIFEAVMTGKVAVVNGYTVTGWAWDRIKLRHVSVNEPVKRFLMKDGGRYKCVQMGGVNDTQYHEPRHYRHAFYWLCKWNISLVGLE